jgi:hypothetical protein
MKTSEYLEILYKIIDQHMGPIEAKNFVSEVIFNIISELQEEHKTITAQEIDSRLSKKVNEYQQAAKSNVA